MYRPPVDARISEAVKAEVETRDHRMKQWLLVVSVVTVALLASAAVSENLMAPWRRVQVAYHRILQEKATDDFGRKLASDFRIQMRQIVVPSLDVVDRCVSCHNGIDDPRMTDDVPQPHRVHPGQYLQWHDPNRFGCTICHRGQGRAMVFDEVKGVGHHWDYPLLPEELTQSSCGLCHDADEVRDAGGERYAAGHDLYKARGCAACHKLAGRGGSMGPELDAEGMKIRGQLPMVNVKGPPTLPQWLTEHFQDPQRVVDGSQMKPPELNDEECEDMTIYMLSLQGRDLPSRYLSPARHLAVYQAAHPDPMPGEELFGQYCAVCHDNGEYGRYDGFYVRFFPAVRGASYVQTASPEYLVETLKKGHPGTLMPAWGEGAGGLRDEELTAIVDYLLEPSQDSIGSVPEEAVAQSMDNEFHVLGDATRGSAVFTRNCSACHGPAGAGALGPSLNSPVFQAAATDGFIYAAIAYGRRNTAMGGFLAPDEGGFAEQDISDLVAHVRTLAARGGTQ